MSFTNMLAVIGGFPVLRLGKDAAETDAFFKTIGVDGHNFEYQDDAHYYYKVPCLACGGAATKYLKTSKQASLVVGSADGQPVMSFVGRFANTLADAQAMSVIQAPMTVDQANRQVLDAMSSLSAAQLRDKQKATMLQVQANRAAQEAKAAAIAAQKRADALRV